MSYPSTWTKVKFGDIAKRKSVRIDNPKESEYERYVGLDHLDSGELVVKRWGSTKDVSSNMQIFNKNDILFARRNTYLRRISVALFDGVCSGDIIVIEPILNHIIEGFLPIYMQFEEFENKVVAWSAGAFSKRIKWKQLSDFEIWIPSKEEQQKIVNVIWTIHDNQERLEKIIQLTEKLKRGLLERLLTKGIGHNKFKKTELGEIPDDWKLYTLKELCSDISYGYTASANEKEVGPKFLRITDIANGKIDWGKVPYCACSETEYNINKLEKDDIVFARTGASTGATAIVEKDIGAVFASYLIRLKCKEIIRPKYLYWFFRSNLYTDQLNMSLVGSAQEGCNANTLKKFYLPLPPTSEQVEIISKIESINNLADRFIINDDKNKKLKKKLTNEFLSGNLLIPKEVLN